MCLGIPGLLVEREDASPDFPSGLVEFAGMRRQISLACVPEAQPGDYVIVHAGVAITKLDPVEAARVLSYLDEIKEDEGWADRPAGHRGD
jgi:hydrogenase expression/formation protein HypC